MRLSILCFMLLLSLLAMSMLGGCKHEPVLPVGGGDPGDGGDGEGPGEDTCDPDTVYFQQEVLPLLISNCAKSGCHDAATAEEGIVLDSYSSIRSSDVIKLSDAGDSELYEVITEDDADKRMPPPPASPLSSEQIGLIRSWIEQGAKDNACSETACDTSNVTFSATIQPILQNKCLGCHSGGAPSGGLSFSTHSGVQGVALSGRLFGAVNHDTGFVPMPQGGNKLPACEIGQIRIWVENGALNN